MSAEGTPLSRFANLAIIAYQRFVSPYKGFSCAHNKLHQDGSCSTSGRRALAVYDVLVAARLIRERLHACKAATATLAMTASQNQDIRPSSSDEKVSRGSAADPCKKNLFALDACATCACLPWF